MPWSLNAENGPDAICLLTRRTMTATEASRNFSDLLDAIERGETVLALLESEHGDPWADA